MSSLVWSYAASQSPSHKPRPLVVFLSWMFAPPSVAAKYTQLINSLGWDCAFYQPNAASMWVPLWSAANSRKVLDEVERALSVHGVRPLVFAAFSGAPKAAYADMLSAMGPVLTPEAAAGAAAGTGAAALTAPDRVMAAMRAAVPNPSEHSAAHEVRAASAADPDSALLAPLQQQQRQQQHVHLTDGPSEEASKGGPSKQGWLGWVPGLVPQRWCRRQKGKAGRGDGGTRAGGVASKETKQLHTNGEQQQQQQQQQGQQGQQQKVTHQGGVLYPPASPATSTNANSAAQAPSTEATTTSNKSSNTDSTASASQYPLCSQCMSGQWFDSGPVDFTSDAGSRMLAGSTAGPRYAACTLVAGALDFSALELFEAQRAHMWQRLAGSALAGQGPSLFTYSWDDAIADPIRVHRLATALRARGCEVVELAWGQSEHCGHFRRHPEAYREGVHTLLSRAQALKPSDQEAPLPQVRQPTESQSCQMHPHVLATTPALGSGQLLGRAPAASPRKSPPCFIETPVHTGSGQDNRTLVALSTGAMRSKL